MNRVLLPNMQLDEVKSTLCDLAVIILSLNTTASSHDADSSSTTTDPEAMCDEADFDKLINKTMKQGGQSDVS